MTTNSVAPPLSAVAFTTPANYAARLSRLLLQKDMAPLWCPTVIVESTPQTLSNLKPFLSSQTLRSFSAVAFTSRAGIASLSAALDALSEPPLPPHGGDAFTIAALGKDSELIDGDILAKFCSNLDRVTVLVPRTASPSGLAEALGPGRGRKVLCPVPAVAGLEEPPVVPDFLRKLAASGWVPVRVDAYETRWAGRECAAAVVRRCEEGVLGAILFTSTAEVEGLLRSLREEYGWDWGTVRRKCPELVAAAHGPVTASGAERLGVDIDLGFFDTTRHQHSKVSASPNMKSSSSLGGLSIKCTRHRGKNRAGYQNCSDEALGRISVDAWACPIQTEKPAYFCF